MRRGSEKAFSPRKTPEKRCLTGMRQARDASPCQRPKNSHHHRVRSGAQTVRAPRPARPLAALAGWVGKFRARDSRLDPKRTTTKLNVMAQSLDQLTSAFRTLHAAALAAEWGSNALPNVASLIASV